MSIQVKNYQCPACTGPLHFAPESGQLECEYCGSSYKVEDMEELYPSGQEADGSKMDAESRYEDDGSSWDVSGICDNWENDAAEIKVYNCPSCGAELMCEESTAAMSCPYCGNPSIVPGQFSGMLKPDYVIPFKLTKDKAVEALKKHYKGKFLLPRSFKKENHIQEIQGVYVPFWLFDGEAEGLVTYSATRTNVYESGEYTVTETKHYRLLREGSLAFEKIPVDASSKMPDEHMDSIEPYDYNELKPFSIAYLPGYLADKYDESIDKCAQRADARCSETLENAFRDTAIGYDTCITEERQIRLNRGKVHYALLPVWLLNTKWQGKDYLFAMNGQTGKLVGDLPTDMKKYWMTYAALSIPLSVLGALLMYFLW